MSNTSGDAPKPETNDATAAKPAPAQNVKPAAVPDPEAPKNPQAAKDAAPKQSGARQSGQTSGPAAKPAQQTSAAQTSGASKPRTAPAGAKPANPQAGGPKNAGSNNAGPNNAGQKSGAKPGAKAAGQKPGGPKAAAQKPEPAVLPVAPKAFMQHRHWGVMGSFLVAVLLPVLLTAAYLWVVADDRYGSTIGFTVRSEEGNGAADLLGGLGSLTGNNAASDGDILYEFIRSQKLVQTIDDQLDLRGHYSADYWSDPVFALPKDTTIEDLTNYWQRIVQVSYDQSTGLSEVEVTAFDADYAQKVAQAVVAESQAMVNALSDAARGDALRYAQDDLTTAQDRLRQTREALTRFRTQTQIVDIDSDIQSRTGVLTNLQQKLAQELITQDELSGTTGENDPRMAQSRRRIQVIRDRIRQERQNLATGEVEGTGQDYPSLMSRYEGLTVEREFAESAYTAALTAYDSARADAARQTRYLATYVSPTLAQSSEYPKRWQILGLTALFLMLAWGTIVLIYYSLRDRG
ncbi:sugar transporter [Rhodobacteraceae bacterium]|nr:sugar transporter [Paracoccaceae bacterium]